MITIRQAEAVLMLWRSRHFNTHEIGRLLKIHEADVERVIHGDRERERAA